MIKRLIYLIIAVPLIFFFIYNNPGENLNDSGSNKTDSFATISMIFAGDIMGHERQINAAFCNEKQEYDYTHCFQYVKPILSDFDLAIGNLEVTLPGKPPYAGYPQFKSPDALAYALKHAGFNGLVTANNHSNDGYGAALIHTIDTLRGLNFYQTGTFKNMAERDSLYPLIIKKNGFKIALLNYTYGTNWIPDEPPTFVNLIDEELMLEDLEKTNSLNPDIVIAFMHWGNEYELHENQEQRETAKLLAENGVDLIIGSHPHVIQPVKYIKTSQNDSVLTVYSLGNYISNQFRPNTDGGMMFEITYKKNKYTGEIVKDSYYHHLVWRYREARSEQHPEGRYFVIPVSKFEKGLLADLNMPAGNKKAIQDFTNNMRKHLRNTSVSTERLFKKDHEIITDDELVLYHVQLIAVSSPAKGHFRNIPTEVIEIKENDYYKYLTRGTKTRKESEKLLKEVQSAGYEDAFIVKYKNNKRVR